MPSKRITITLIVIQVIIFLALLGVSQASETNKYAPNGGKAIRTIKRLDLRNANVVILDGAIGNSSAKDVVSDLYDMARQKDTKEIYMLIDSPGGSVVAGMGIVSAIKAIRPIKVNCVVNRAAMSMAAMIAQYCSTVYMMKVSVLMFHNVSVALDGPLTDVVNQLKFLLELTDVVIGDFAAQLGVEKKVAWQFLQHETWLTPRQAIPLGLADVIVEELLR